MLPYEKNLGDGLILRTVRDERDIDRYVALNTRVWEARTAWTSDYLLRHHPEIGYDDFMYVEDECTGEMLSTTGLIPWHCRFEEVTLEMAMLEMVGTHPEHRHRGLIRAQVQRFHQMLDERGFDLSTIEGIPYYYRQYGYSYALDHRAQDSLPVWRIPNGPTDPYRLRQATLEDVPTLTRLYQEAMAPLQFHELRDEAYWRFLLRWVRYPTRVVEDQRTGRVVGYLCTASLNHAGLTVMESGITGYDVGIATLRLLKAETQGEIRLGWPESCTLVQIARSLGSVALPIYQWLVRICDVAGLLSKLRPILERRVAASPFAGLTADVCLNLYKQATMLHFEGGRLRVEAIGFVDASMGTDGGDIRVPPEAFPCLIFGYRRLEELRDAWPDIGVKPEVSYLTDVLFPRVTSCLCVPYLYCGPLPPEPASSLDMAWTGSGQTEGR